MCVAAVCKVASDISDPSDHDEEINKMATPLLRPPHPFTAMNVQQREPHPLSPVSTPGNVSHDFTHTSHDSRVRSHDFTRSSHDSQVRSRDLEQGGGHEVDPELARLGGQLDEWCSSLKHNVLVSRQMCGWSQ